MPGGEPVKPLVFVHVPKAAGTSLKDLIARNCAGSRCLFFSPGDGRLARFRTLPAAVRAGCAVVGGHEPFGLQDVYDGTGLEPSVVTVLREPVARVCSLYRYIFREPAHAQHARFVRERPSLGSVIAEGALPAFDNHQVRYLAGGEAFAKPVGSLDESDLETAKRNLEQGCRVFGLQERMGESLAMFRAALRWSSVEMPSLNTAASGGPDAVEIPAITDEDRATVAEANGLDAALYAFAVGVFESRLAGTDSES